MGTLVSLFSYFIYFFQAGRYHPPFSSLEPRRVTVRYTRPLWYITIRISPTELELWVQLLCLLHDTAEDALQVLRDDLGKAKSIEIYIREEAI